MHCSSCFCRCASMFHPGVTGSCGNPTQRHTSSALRTVRHADCCISSVPQWKENYAPLNPYMQASAPQIKRVISFSFSQTSTSVLTNSVKFLKHKWDLVATRQYLSSQIIMLTHWLKYNWSCSSPFIYCGYCDYNNKVMKYMISY